VRRAWLSWWPTIRTPRNEAKLRCFEGYEGEFPYGGTLLDIALTSCDPVTSPDGEPDILEDRVAELVHRYGVDHMTSRAVLAGVPDFEHGREQIRRLRADAGMSI
jgi:hypothetical protein